MSDNLDFDSSKANESVWDCDICGESMHHCEVNEDRDLHLSCEEEANKEQICCPVCWSASDFCQGHGVEELGAEPDCEICGEPVDYFKFDCTCQGHSKHEIKEYQKMKKEESCTQ